MAFIPQSTVDCLTNLQEEFNLFNLHSEEDINATNWLEKNYPIASWGRIAWDKVENSTCYYWDSTQDIVTAFQNIVVTNNLKGRVIIVWGNGLKLGIEINLDVLIRNSPVIFEEDSDIWICCHQYSWCIEVYHEGEICFGFHG
jgi:hypothetical protein